MTLFSACKIIKKTLQNKKHSVQSLFLIIAITCVTHFAHAQPREMTPYPRVKLQSLDKATARTMTFEAKVGSTLKFGTLYMQVKSCQKSSPIDKPEAAAFLQVWEVDTDENAKWIFSGWMFASSPGLSPMDHPIYDVWVLDCLDHEEQPGHEDEKKEAINQDDTLE